MQFLFWCDVLALLFVTPTETKLHNAVMLKHLKQETANKQCLLDTPRKDPNKTDRWTYGQTMWKQYTPTTPLPTLPIFVCVEVLRPSQPNRVMSSAVSLPNHTFTGQALSSKRLTSIVHILSPETDNCPSWISGRERMTVENISWSISTKECCRPRRGSNPRPPGLQSDAHPTEPPRPAIYFMHKIKL